MSAEHNAAVVRRAVEAIWNRGELDVADRLFAADYANNGGVIPDLVHGPEAIKLSVALYRAAFPDLHITVDEVIADQDTVLLRWTARSTRPGEPDSSESCRTRSMLTGVTISRLAGGQVMESATHWDRTAVLARLGVRSPEEGTWSTA